MDRLSRRLQAEPTAASTLAEAVQLAEVRRAIQSRQMRSRISLNRTDANDSTASPSGKDSAQNDFADLFATTGAVPVDATTPADTTSGLRRTASSAMAMTIGTASTLPPVKSFQTMVPSTAPAAAGGGTLGLTTSGFKFDFASGDGDEANAADEDLLGFRKVCALCIQSFPKKALEMRVLWKHVITLRYVIFDNEVHQLTAHMFNI